MSLKILSVVSALCAIPLRAATPAPAAGPVLPPDALVKPANKVLPPDAPDPSLAPVKLELSVQWDKTVRQLPPEAWGMNDYEMLSPELAADEGFNRALTLIKPSWVRIHQGGMPSQWLDSTQRKWDVEKIRKCWASAAGLEGIPVMFNISTWPGWMSDEQGCLKPEHEQAYAQLYVDLLRIMRDDIKRPITWWEITNERDGHYAKLNRLDDLWRVYNTVARAIKAEDPNAKVGGPAFTWANPEWVDSFVKSCISNTDFVTYHNYGTGDMYDTNETLFGKLDGMGATAKRMRETLDKASPDRHIAIYLDEYNVKWVWTPVERRHANTVGSAFHVGVVNRAMRGGIDGTALWHFKGNSYGIVDGGNKLRPSAYLFLWAPKYLVGRMADLTVSDPAALEAIAIESATGRSLLLANKSPRTIQLGSLDQFDLGRDIQRHEVNAHENFEGPAADSVDLPGYSVVLLTGSK